MTYFLSLFFSLSLSLLLSHLPFCPCPVFTCNVGHYVDHNICHTYYFVVFFCCKIVFSYFLLWISLWTIFGVFWPQLPLVLRVWRTLWHLSCSPRWLCSCSHKLCLAQWERIAWPFRSRPDPFVFYAFWPLCRHTHKMKNQDISFMLNG